MEKRDKNISYLRFVITYNIVLLIPLLIVSFSVFYMVHRQHYRKIMDETAVSAERQADYFSRSLLSAPTMRTAATVRSTAVSIPPIPRYPIWKLRRI